MKFSKKFLDSISYYRQYNKESISGYYTIVEIHFVQWWKFKKKFKFHWSCEGYDDGFFNYRKPSQQINDFISKLEGN